MIYIAILVVGIWLTVNAGCIGLKIVNRFKQRAQQRRNEREYQEFKRKAKKGKCIFPSAPIEL